MEGMPTRTALIVVHGIGEQRRLDTARKVVRGLSRVYADELSDVENVEEGTIDLVLRGSPVHVRLYEMHWATLFDENAKGSFIAESIQSVAVFPWLNRRHRLYKARRRLPPMILWTSVLWLLSSIAYLGVWGLRLFGSLAMGLSGRAPQAVSEGPLWQRARDQARLARHAYTPVDERIDKVVGDVFQYVSGSAPNKPPGVAADQVRALFFERLEAARSDGCDDVQVLAHSLGTVVVYNALTGYRLPEAQANSNDRPLQVSRFWTIGSPLEKFAYFFPTMTQPEALAAYQTSPGLAGVRGVSTTPRWINFFNPLDPVAGRLRSFPGWHIDNRRVWAGGMGRSHVVYERNARFLEALTEALFGAARVMPVSMTARLGGFLAAALESVLLLLVLAIPVVAGVALLTFVALLLPWIAGTLIGLVFSEEVEQGIRFWGAMVLGVPLLATVLTQGLVSAGDEHRAWRLRGSGQLSDPDDE
jgi:hypothetical protein